MSFIFGVLPYLALVARVETLSKESTTTKDQIEQEIKKLAHDWMDAVGRRDPVVLDRLLADDFMISGWLFDGSVARKEVYIADCLRPVDIEQASYTYDQWKVHAHGDTAIVNCVFRCHALVGGRDWGGDFIFTDVWVRERGRWRVVTRHSSPLLATVGK